MRVDQIRQRLWLGATGMFFLSLLVTAADRTGMLAAFRPALHDTLSPGRLMVLAISLRAAVGTEETAAKTSDSGDSEQRLRHEKLCGS
jgi:hypothetical protein